MTALEIFAVVFSGMALLAIIGLLVGLRLKGSNTSAWRRTSGRPDERLLESMDLQGTPSPEENLVEPESLAERWREDAEHAQRQRD